MKTCPHCHKPLETVSVETEQVLPEANDPVIEAATKKVVAEVLKVIDPLLQKLQEANTSSTVQTQTPADAQKSRVDQIQESAKKRLEEQEKNFAFKLEKLQARFGK